MLRGKSYRFLIVDDEIESLNPLCDFLSEWGFDFMRLTSSREALEIIRQQDFDLLITDLVMPEMDGIKLIQNALKIRPLLVCIVITGKGTIQTAVEAMKIGAFDYILKPIEFKTMRQILHRALEVRRLRISEEKYRAIVEDQTELIFRFLPDGTLTFVNEVYCRYFQKSEDKLIGYKFLHLVFKDDRDFVCKKIQSLNSENPVISYEYRVIKPNGDICWLQCTNRAILDKEDNIFEFQVVGRDVTEQKRAEEELRNSKEQLRNLSAHLQSLREKERMHIAREIHDELGQALTALKMDLFWLRTRLPKEQKLLYEKIRTMTEFVEKTSKTVQRISAELRPGLLDDLGLSAAIEWQAREFQKRTGILCEVSIVPEDIKIEQEISTAIFRIFQETLTNIARHANATLVDVKLKEENGIINLKVRDNGKGISEEEISHPKSFGLIGIRERVYLLGGEVNISGVQNKGTTVKVSIPIGRQE